MVVNDVRTGVVKGKKVLQKIYIVGKIAAIYGGGFVLTKSYIENKNRYKQFLAELQYRRLNDNKPNPDGGLTQYPGVDNLTAAKNIFKRNKDVVLFSLIGLYGMNVLDAYITTRLKYFNVDENIAFKISPTVINSNTIYSYNMITPGIKLTLKL